MRLTRLSPPFMSSVGESLLRSNSPVSSILPDYHSSEDSRPPLYSRHSRPDIPISYSFSDLGYHDIMLLVPQSSAALPSYKISVSLNLNPLLPISVVTRVEMENSQEDVFTVVASDSGGTEHGYQPAYSAQQRAIKCGYIASALVMDLDSSDPIIDNMELRWDCRTRLDDGSPMCVCYDSLDRQLATFVPPPLLVPPPLPPAVFTVFPDGHQHFEHILMSMLVVQRKMSMLL
ncbi:hypothetical protein D9757_004580 [Collybiopsis confluens]|uniref:Uncharacterized protein n=1 Tax=Collybiopsis confluens TaxID=2823264 RepID=A0A8H5HRY3_9AGAR|nr:hypothetical protein D9757_004580 [Collybiopsis confluens]